MDDSILDKVIAAKLSEEVQQIRTSDVLVVLLAELAEREREVLARRFGLQGKGAQTLKEIGLEFAITRERVRQIESHSLEKLRALVADGRLRSQTDPLIHSTMHILEENGGILARHHLWDLICQLSAISLQDEVAKTSFEFIVEYLLIDRVDALAESRARHAGWKLHFVDIAKWESTIASAVEILNTEEKPLEEDTFFASLRGRHSDVDNTVLRAHVMLSRTIRKNFFGHWGLSHWNIVVPRRVNDKIYLILKKEGKPLHFTEITKKINDARFDQKIAYPSTVHNELILDKNYVLVGRGMYALKEWGYKPGVVSDVIVEVLTGHSTGLDRERIVDEALKRRIVRKSTILLALTDHERFQRLPDGRYVLVTPASSDAPVS